MSVPISVMGFKNVSKSFGTGTNAEHVLKGIDLKIEEGEFVVLLGFSGTGKTTLINLMAGIEMATKGSVSFKGQAITGPSPARGVIFQSYSLMPWLTVTGNARLAVDVIFPKMSKAKKAEKVAHYVKIVNLSDAAPSGGIVGRNAPAGEGGAGPGDGSRDLVAG